ncbi:CPBP family intramembrane glutamic endopeptidase [Paenibacillus sp. D2_2]|uniref:CPBP family intramembrane glutamic endopeptidase n=1 Tax=Paenibacillus sp. D2_2 TaxID=3073092 RepID=UPI0028154BBD|nr:CPBP family intramembrane glutamic endopeptidase [Paenibacillus sp. D2_2]WMT41701.1 CPBP family intramembrane glutamic endopeptidase [Paenibacillus sp. D2_2]
MGVGDVLKNAWLISFIRFPLLIIILLIFFVLFQLCGLKFHFPFLLELSTLYFTVVNVICFYLLNRILKKEGRSIKELIDFRSDRIGKDIVFGFLWLLVLYIPFIIVIMGTMFVMYGTGLFNHFQTVFVGDENNFAFARPGWLIWLTASISLAFPFLNAPIEELMYRGYAQPSFIQTYKKVWLGITIPSIGFALQHIMLAGSFQGAIVYAVAFFVWGIGGGIIFYRQKRLFPLIVCHFIVNIAFSMIPIMFLAMGA